MTKRVLLVGLGRFGQNHLRVLAALGAPLALVDRDPALLERSRRAAPDARCSTDIADLLPESFAADIVVPAQVHAPLATRCLEAGLAVFVEKPLAPTSEEAIALARLADAKKAVLQTGFIFRHHPATRAALALIAKGAIGRPHTLRARFTGFKRPRTDGGCAINDAVHFADLATVVFGKPPASAQGAVRDFLGTGREDTAFLSFDFPSTGSGGPGGVAHVEASYHTPERERTVLVVGDAGSIAVDFDAGARAVSLHRQAHRKAANGQLVAEEEEPEYPAVSEGEPLRVELEDFLANARSGERPAADGWAGARATAAIEAALLAAREGRSVAVRELGP